MKRILITGSREWTDASLITRELNRVKKEFGPFILIHGACFTGADDHASKWLTRHLECTEEAYPANWRMGKKAGPERNRAMIATGVDLCLAFIVNESPGATQCLTEAIKAGVPWRLWELRYEEFPPQPRDNITVTGTVTYP